MGGGVPLVMTMKRRWCSRNTVLGLGGANHWLWKRTVLGISCTRFDCPEWLIFKLIFAAMSIVGFAFWLLGLQCCDAGQQRATP